MKRLFDFVDQNKQLSDLLSQVSSILAVNRGAPMLGGTLLVVLSCILTGVVLPIIVSDANVPDIWILLCLPALILHLGLFIGFTGFMMAEPLGRGYRE